MSSRPTRVSDRCVAVTTSSSPKISDDDAQGDGDD